MNKPVLVLSAIIGIGFGIVMGPFFSSGPAESLQITIVAAILMTGLLYIVIDMIVKNQQHKHQQLEKLVDQPIIHAITGNVNVGKKIYCCRICFCSDRVAFIYTEKKPYSITTLLYSSIVKWEHSAIARVAVHTQDQGTFYIQIADADIQIIRDKIGLSII